jgi:transcriptional regulator GlxA family with amidase domain
MVCVMRIGLLVQDGCFTSAVTSVIDIIQTGELVRPRIDPALPALDLVLAGPRRRVTIGSGLTITTQRTLRELDDLDVVVVPALGTMTGPDTETAVAGPDGRAVVRALRTVDPDRSRMAAACTGVFPLAETGLLDGRRVTTTWFLTTTFRARYPAVDVDLDSMVVADGPFLTAGAAFAHIDVLSSSGRAALRLRRRPRVGLPSGLRAGVGGRLS